MMPCARFVSATILLAFLPGAPGATQAVNYDGVVSVLIRNQTGQPVILSGLPNDEATCRAVFQFDEYHFLTTPGFFQVMPVAASTQPNIAYSACYAPEAFRAIYGVQLSSGEGDMGYLSVACFFDVGGCEAAISCPVKAVGFQCGWSGGVTEFRFTLSAPSENPD